MNLLSLCWEFFKIGLFSFGGGNATIPFLYDLASKHPEWLSDAQVTDMIAIAESTPGPIGVNMATYVGFNVGGSLGSVLATISLVLPAFLIVLIIARMLQRFRDNRWVEAGFSGLRPAVTGLVASAAYTVMLVALFPVGAMNLIALGLFVAMLAATQTKKLGKLHPIVYIAVAAVLGIVFKL